MKILHVNNFRRVYGTEKYVNEIIEMLTLRGHQNHLFIQEWDKADNGFKALKNTRINLRNLRIELDSFKPDVIHVHNIVNFRILEFLLKSAPCLKSLHDYRPFCLKVQMRQDNHQICGKHLSLECFRAGCFSWKPGAIYRYFADKISTRQILKFPRIWVMSNYMKRYMEPLITGPGQLDMVHYFYDAPKEEPPAAPTEPRIFSAGRLDPEKGYDRLIRALALLKIPYQVKIAGEGIERNRLEALASSLNVDIDFLGYIPNQELKEWYRWSRVVIFPSIAPEPFGLVGLEAMGEARAVIAFDVGGVSDWLDDGKTGFLVRKDDVGVMAEKIAVLLGDHDACLTMGAEGRRQLIEKFPSSKHLDKLESTYQELVSGKV